jgi:glutathione S-transferase
MLTLHHLLTSRSSRIIWLLEALGTPYNLVTHKRDQNMRAQADLAAIHPLGKAPTIVDGDLVLVESSAILRYISEHHGNSRFMPPAGTNARAKHDEWLDYAESSLMMPVILKLSSLMGGGQNSLADFAAPEFEKALDHVTNGITPGPFLMGAELTLADMQISYCLSLMESAGLLQNRPEITAYWQRLQAEPSFKRAIEIGGPMVSPYARMLETFEKDA